MGKGFLLVLLTGFLQPAFSQPFNKDSLSTKLKKDPSDSLTATLYNLQLGYDAYQASKYDSAVIFLQMARQSAKRLKNDTLQIKALNLIGDAWADKGDNPVALPYYQEAVQLAQQAGMEAMRGRIIKNIGVLYVSWQKLPEALKHYDSALAIAKSLHDKWLEADCLNNKGIVYEISEDYPKAIELYEQALAYYTQIQKKASIAMVYSNLAIAYKYSGRLDKSIEYNLKGLELAREMKDKWKEAAMLNNIGSAYLKMNEPQKAYEFARQSVDLSNAINAKEIGVNAYQTLSEAAYALGRYQEATDHLRSLMLVKDSFINLESTRQMAELQTKYETAQKEQLIQKQQFDLQRKNYAIGATVGGTLLLVLLALVFYRKEKFKQEQKRKQELLEQQEAATKAVLDAEEAERRRIAAELHDGVGQLMSAARMNLEAIVIDLKPIAGDNLLKLERVVGLVDEGCREVRAVSHSMMPNALLKRGLGSALHDFIQKIDQEIIKIHLHLEGLQDRLPAQVESVLYRVIQECVNNVIKHSGADKLDISVLKDVNNIDITIEDNGRGFKVEEASGGIGLQNIRARIHYLKGTLDIESGPGRGTFIGIFIPL